MSGFLEKVVLLSSAVADADNNVMMHGRKLELLVGLENDLRNLEKSEIISAQKKIEDLCLRLLFQNCPHILISPTVRVLSLLFSRGSNGSMHACVSHLLQLSVYSQKDSPHLDRPVPGLDEEESKTRTVSIQEKAVCLQVASGIVASRGPSASYFFTPILGSVVKHMKLPDPAARDSAIQCLTSVIDSVGIPGTPLAMEVWKHVLYKAVYQDKSPHVRSRSAVCLGSFCRKSKQVALANSETILGIILKFLTASAEQIADQTGCVGLLLLETRNAFVNSLVELICCGIDENSSTKKSVDISTNSSFSSPNNLSLKSNDVTDPLTAFSFIFQLIKKYKNTVWAIEAFSTVLVRILIKFDAKEEDCLALCRTVISEIPIASIATRVVARIVNACTERRGDSSALRLASEVLLPLIRTRDYTGSKSDEIYMAIGGLCEVINSVGSSIVALGIETIASDLVALVSSTSSTQVAIHASFCLRCLVCENPNQKFSLVNILLNHITIQNAELLSSSKQSALFVRSMMHFSIALASVMRECVSSVPSEILSAIVNTANNLIDSEDLDMVALQRKSCGYILLIPVLSFDVTVVNIVTLLGMWRSCLGKKSKESLSKLVMPGQTITDIGTVFEFLQTIHSCLRSIYSATENEKFSTLIASDESVQKMFVLLLNNGLQILQALGPLEISSSNTAPHIQLVIAGIRNELFKIISHLDKVSIDQFAKPLITLLTTELFRDEIGSNEGYYINSLFESSLTTFLDLLDPIVDEQPRLVWKYALGTCVVSTMHVLCGIKSLSIRDYFDSSLSSGGLEEFFACYPSSTGSPWCPQIPYMNIISTQNQFGSFAAFMEHPGFESKRSVISLLTKLVSNDPSLIDSLLPVLTQKFRDQSLMITSQDYETSRDVVEIMKNISSIPSSYTAGSVLAFLQRIVREGKISPSSASSILTFAASPTGLGSIDMFVRRTCARLIGNIYERYEPLRPMIVQCVMDSCTSPVLRTRAATAALVSEIVSLVPSDISIFGNALFKLARELQMPLRSISLFAISQCSNASLSGISPWIKELIKITTAHAMADIYRSDAVQMLLAKIIASLAPLMGSDDGVSDLRRFDLLWTEFVNNNGLKSTSQSLFQVELEKACVAYAVASRPSTDDKLMFIKNSLASHHQVVVREALNGMKELISVVDKKSFDHFSSSLYQSLFTVSESDPSLRFEINSLLKALVKEDTNLLSSASQILTMLSVVASPPQQQPLEQSTTEQAPNAGGGDEYGESDEYDEEGPPVGKKTNFSGTKKVSVVKKPDVKTFRISTVSNKWLALKCLKRIVKKAVDILSGKSLGSILDALISASVGAVSMDTSNNDLSRIGMKIILLIFQIFGNEKDPKISQPLLMQYETQLLSVVRRGVRMNSESSTEVQNLAVVACREMIRKKIVSSPDKLLELLVQQFLVIDPVTIAPWSTYYALREIAITVSSGRSTSLIQNNEQDLASVLFTKISTIVDLIEENGVSDYGENFVARFEYYLIRLMLDCFIVRSDPLVVSAGLAFTLLPKGSLNLSDDVVLAILRGLAAIESSLELPSDCPNREIGSVADMYCGLLSELLKKEEKRIGDFAGPVWHAIHGLHRKNLSTLMNVFASPRVTDTHDERLVKLAYRLVTEGGHGDGCEAGVIWNLAKSGGKDIEKCGTILSWLCEANFFRNVDDVRFCVNEIILKFLETKNPQNIVKIWRDIIDKTSSSYILNNMMLVMSDVIEKVEQVKRSQFAIVLSIPLFSRICAVCQNGDEDSMVGFAKFRCSLIAAASSGLVGPVTQCIHKFFTCSPPTWIVEEFLFGLVIELIDIAGSEEGSNLVSSLVECCPESKWKHLVSFAMKMLIKENDAEESWAKIVLRMMRPPEVFRECIAELSVDDKAGVEEKVRKYIPQQTEAAASPTGSPKNQAPAIQLKLKFGK